jgi:DNA-binding MarR family transcriptional regulator/predicted GNAT family acetyltransferase
MGDRLQSSRTDPIEPIRRFNRFYTRQIGILQEGVYKSSLSLTEVRLLYELAHRSNTTAQQLSRELGLDPGYLSRIFSKFGKNGWLKRVTSQLDRRQTLLSLTRQGAAALRPLEERSNEQVQEMLAPLSPNAQQQLLQAMQRIEEILSPAPVRHDAFLLRPHQPGDFGWIVSRHGTLYWNDQRYDQRFEALVAQIVADFVKKFDAQRDCCCWIAEKDGERAGAVILVHRSAVTAQLRALFVESFARGMGIGRRLVQECIRFAGQVGYEKIVLWTQRELKAARRIYQQEHFKLVKEEPCQEWGRDDLVAETWELRLLPRQGSQVPTQ